METNQKLEGKLDDIKERLIVIETKMEMIKGVEKEATEGLQTAKNANRRLDKLESNNTWLWRTVIATVVIGAINLLFQYVEKGGL